MIIKELNPLYFVCLTNQDPEARELLLKHAAPQVPDILSPMKNTVMASMAFFMFLVQALVNPNREEACQGHRYSVLWQRMEQRGMHSTPSISGLNLDAIRAVLGGIHDYEYVEGFKRLYELVLPVEFNRLDRDMRAWQYAYDAKVELSEPKWTALTLHEIRAILARDLLRDSHLIYQAELVEAFRMAKRNELVASAYQDVELSLSYWEGLRAKLIEYWNSGLLLLPK